MRELDMLHDATDLASRSFINTISYREIYRIENDDEILRQHLAYLYHRNFLLISWAYPEGIYSFYDDNRTSLEVFFMLVPSTIHISMWQKLQAGMLMIALNSGLQVFSRLLKAAEYFEEKEKEIMRGMPYLSLQRMAVHPDKQGKGIGSLRLGLVLREVADKAKLPVVLGTQNLRNVRFYERLGFELVRTARYAADPHPDDTRNYDYITYFMRREPCSYSCG